MIPLLVVCSDLAGLARSERVLRAHWRVAESVPVLSSVPRWIGCLTSMLWVDVTLCVVVVRYLVQKAPIYDRQY